MLPARYTDPLEWAPLQAINSDIGAATWSLVSRRWRQKRRNNQPNTSSGAIDSQASRCRCTRYSS